MAKKKKLKQERKAKHRGGEDDSMALTREITEKVYRWDLLENRCLIPIQSYIELADRMPNATVVDRETDNPYIFIDNGAKVLGVAHLDTVSNSSHFANIKVAGDWWVLAAQLDDRLGVFLLLDVLRYLGANYDILLTTGEESARSSAKKFVAPEGKEYNWMFECDRAGTDVVRYQYDDLGWESMLRKAGFGPIGHGSYTDICSLENLGVAGFNMGVAYTDYHGLWAKANMTDCARQVAKLLKFFHLYGETKVPFERRAVAAYSYRGGAGVEGSANWRGYNGRPPANAMFKKGDQARVKKTGQIVTINSDWPTTVHHGNVPTHKWWCRYNLPDNPRVQSWVDFNEHELEKLTVDVAFKPEPNEAATDASPLSSVEDVGIPTRERQLLSRSQRRMLRSEAHSKSIMELRYECEGEYPQRLTQEARWDYEDWLFSTAIAANSGELFSDFPPCIFNYLDFVMTPDGLGSVDSPSPVLVRGEEPQWWVRLTVPDRFGWHCHMYPESELTAVTVPVTPEESPAPPASAPLLSLTSPIQQAVQDAVNGATYSNGKGGTDA